MTEANPATETTTPSAPSAPAPALQGCQLTLGAESSLASIHVLTEEGTAPDQSPLAEAEQLELRRLEGTIRSGLKSYIEVGEALGEIQQKRLYRFQYPTFEEYCVNRWGFRRAHAYRLINASKTARTLSPIGDTGSPAVESHARLLNKLPAEQQEGAMARAKALAGDKKVTTAHVKEAVDEIRQKNAPAPAGVKIATVAATAGSPRAAVSPATSDGSLTDSMKIAEISQILSDSLGQVRQSQTWRAALELLERIEAALQLGRSSFTGPLNPHQVSQPAPTDSAFSE